MYLHQRLLVRKKSSESLQFDPFSKHARSMALNRYLCGLGILFLQVCWRDLHHRDQSVRAMFVSLLMATSVAATLRCRQSTRLSLLSLHHQTLMSRLGKRTQLWRRKRTHQRRQLVQRQRSRKSREKQRLLLVPFGFIEKHLSKFHECFQCTDWILLLCSWGFEKETGQQEWWCEEEEANDRRGSEAQDQFSFLLYETMVI